MITPESAPVGQFGPSSSKFSTLSLAYEFATELAKHPWEIDFQARPGPLGSELGHVSNHGW